MFIRRGALFFGELLTDRSLLPSRVERALAELSAQGWVTSDSFEGLRALLIPQEKRLPFTDAKHRRRHKGITSLEFAGRWSLLRKEVPQLGEDTEERTAQIPSITRDAAIETFARVLLRRYGVVFRRVIERESLNVTWYDLGRVYRRLEARGEIRGGHFVSGVGGEQFALPEAIGLLRSIRKSPAEGELLAISAADPLNLAGILSPGRRVTSITSNRLLLRDGVPIAALEGGEVETLGNESKPADDAVGRALRMGTMPTALRPYYA
jgi:ATP-dependent Lhr-like helicase